MLSRRNVLKRSAAAAVAGGAATLLGGAAVSSAQPGSAAGAQSTSSVAGRKFKAWVTRGTGPNNGSLQELTLRAIGGRQVVVRTEATACCYSNASWMLGQPPSIPGFPVNTTQATILGHGGVGIVEAVGPQVKRVQVGDRVIVGVTPECGQCYQCLRGRADFCQMLFEPEVPVADMAGGGSVTQATNIGGHAELMVIYEEWCVPVFTRLPAVELALLSCQGSTGLGAATVIAPVEAGSDVVVLGAGPVGLSAIQGARINGAAQIISVDPIKYRRDLALKLGATVALDPNAEGDKLVARIRDLCKGPTSRKFGGGRATGFNSAGPDFVIEAAGGSPLLPKGEKVPDPTGIQPLQQAWELCTFSGHVTTLGVIYTAATVSFSGAFWSISGRTHHSSNFGGTHLMRDVPRYVRLIEKGLYDTKSLATSTYPLARTKEAFQAIVDRTTVASVFTFA